MNKLINHYMTIGTFVVLQNLLVNEYYRCNSDSTIPM